MEGARGGATVIEDAGGVVNEAIGLASLSVPSAVSQETLANQVAAFSGPAVLTREGVAGRRIGV